MRTVLSRIEPSLLLGKARFSLQKAEQHTRWLAEARKGQHTPETDEYGISSFVFRARRPFHPERLEAALGGGRPRAAHCALANLLRLKGVAWLAPWDANQAHAALAGTQLVVAPGPLWWAATPPEEWPKGLKSQIDELWHEDCGDRQTELVCIGKDLEQAAVEAALNVCLLTDEEMARGKESWLKLANPFGEVEDHTHEHEHEHSHRAHANDPSRPLAKR